MDRILEALHLVTGFLCNQLYPAPECLIKDGSVWIVERYDNIRIEICPINEEQFDIIVHLPDGNKYRDDRTDVDVKQTAFMAINTYMGEKYFPKINTILKNNNLEEFIEFD